MKYKRTPVTTKEILAYIRLRLTRLKEGLEEHKEDEKSRKHQEVRTAELDRLLTIIWNDRIRKEIEKMKKHKYRKSAVSTGFSKEKEEGK